MEMTLTVHVPRRRPRPVDVLVRWTGRHTALDLCARLADHLGEPVAHLSTRGRPIPPDAVVGQPPLVHGAAVTVTSTGVPQPISDAEPTAGTLLQLVVVGGPDAGHARPLSPPGVDVGRAPASGLVLDDQALSRVHAAVQVDGAGVLVQDRDSTNGVLVDGWPVTGGVPLDTASIVVVGSSTLRLRRPDGRGVPLRTGGDGRIVVPPSRPAPAVDGPVEIDCPAAPPERHRARIPWVAALVPVPVGIGLAVFFGPQLLAFALLGPVMLLAGALGDRWGAGRERRRDAAAHADATREARARLEHALHEERARLDREHPDPHAVLRTAEQRLPGLWSGAEGLPVRLGLGAAPTRVSWTENGIRSRPTVASTPVVVSLADAGCLAVVGPRERTDAVLRLLVGQLCTTQPPTGTRVAVVAGPPGTDWTWCDRLPHALPLPSAPSTTGAPDGSDVAGTVRVLVVPSGRAGTSPSLVATARAAGWLVVAATGDRAALPAGCGAVLDLRSDGVQVLEAVGATTVTLVADGVGAWWADRLSRALAPLRLGSSATVAGDPSRPLPVEVALHDLLLPGTMKPRALVEGWVAARARGAGLAAPVAAVGVSTAGVYALDLARDGPHALVGGTTGSGKSEFLRTLVTSLAVASSPLDLNLVLVDFKGGAAFGPCADLPHVVGFVTDLDDHLASRALVSLRAELRRREALLVRAGVDDLEAYARSDHAARVPLPRLVVVVDELRTLVEAVPELVSGLVRLAAQGRSLGMHLVLATQRPAGAVTAEVQANVSLRIAFRVRDRSDSVAVVEDTAAADVGAHTPGRAVARGADGHLTTFQSAIVAPSRGGPRRPSIRVLTPGHGHGPDDDAPDPPDVRRQDRSRHLSQMVRAIAEAHRTTGAPAPRRPWLPALPDGVTLDQATALLGVGPRPPGSTGIGLVDEPDRQRITPLLWCPQSGTWLLCGRPRSGRTSGLRAVVVGAAAVSSPAVLHVHLVAPTSGLDDLAALPHVGTHVTGAERRGLAALVQHLGELVTRRRSAGSTQNDGPDAAWPTVLVVVDGWEQLVEAHPETVTPVAQDLVRVLRDGAAVGVVGVLSGGRALLHPRWGGLAATTVVLGPLDPLDVALAGLRAADVPQHLPPGRGIRLQDRREVQLALVRPSDIRTASAVTAPPQGAGAWRHRPLPEIVEPPPRATATGDATRHPTRSPGDDEHAVGTGYPLGVFGPEHEVWRWVPHVHGRSLLVAGPPGSGRTNTLRVLAASVAASGRPVVVVTRSAPLTTDAVDPLRPSASGGRRPWREVSPRDVTTLVEARRRHPRLAVLVDDADLVDDAPVGAALHEVLDLVDRDDGLVVVTTTSASLSSRFRGLDVAAARRRVGLLLQPGPADAELLGAPRVHGIPAVPGRGLFVSAGSATEVQVYLATTPAGSGAARASVVGVDARDPLRRGGDAERGHGRGEGQSEHHPADEHLVPLHESHSHGHEQGAPHDRRGPGPVGATEPPPGQQPEREATDEDEQGRHEHPCGVAALADDELVDVERGEGGERERLDAGEPGGEATRTGRGVVGHGRQRNEQPAT